MRNALREVLTTVDEHSLEKFIKFLDKDKRGRINYTEFTNKMNDVSNREHNPFHQLARRLNYFIQQNNISVDNLLKKMSISEQKRGINSPHGSVSVIYFTNFLKNKVDKKRTFDELKAFATMMDID